MTATASTATVRVGDVFVRSWGYDQTNVNFYEIVRVSASGKTAKARELKLTATSAGGHSDRVVPQTGPDRFVSDARCARCQNYHRGAPETAWWNDHAYIDEYGWAAKTDQVTVDYDHAYRWDGEPEYQTSYGYGH